MKNKKSQSGIIVTVLLVLVGIAAVVVLAAWIIPMIRDNLQTSGLRFDLSFDRDGTFYDPDGSFTNLAGCSGCGSNQSATYVKITRGPMNAADSDAGTSLYAVKFIFQIGGKSLTYINTDVPGELESKTYYFALYGENKPDSVKIAPVVLSGSGQKTLDVADETLIRTVDGYISVDKLERCSILVSGSIGNMPPVPPEISC